MSNVFSLFILVLLFIELLLIDGCMYDDGQRVRLKDLKKKELNGKYGIISNKKNDKPDRCGVQIDGEQEPKAIKFENLDKIPTIFISSGTFALINKRQLYDVIADNLQDKFGLPHGNNMIKAFRNYGIITENVFAFGDDQVQKRIKSYDDDDTFSNSLWEESIVESMIFADDKLFNELQESVGINLEEWRDFKMKHMCLDFLAKFIGPSEKLMNKQHYISECNKGLPKLRAMKSQIYSKLDKIHEDMGCETEEESLEKYFDISEMTKNEIIDNWLEIVKKHLVEEMKNDAFIDLYESYGNIVQEVLNKYVNFVKENHKFDEKQLSNFIAFYGIMTSKKIVNEYLANYHQKSNVYVFGNAPPKLLQKIIQERLSMIKNEQEMHVTIA